MAELTFLLPCWVSRDKLRHKMPKGRSGGSRLERSSKAVWSELIFGAAIKGMATRIQLRKERGCVEPISRAPRPEISDSGKEAESGHLTERDGDAT